MDKIKKLKPEQEVLYHDGKTLYEIAKVIEINKPQKIAKLSNKVVVSRIPSGEIFGRTDGKEGYALPLNEKNQTLFQAFKAYHELKRRLENIHHELRNGFKGSDPSYILKLNNLLKDL